MWHTDRHEKKMHGGLLLKTFGEGTNENIIVSGTLKHLRFNVAKITT